MSMANRKKLSRSTCMRRSTACCVKDYHNILFISDVDRVDRVDRRISGFKHARSLVVKYKPLH